MQNAQLTDSLFAGNPTYRLWTYAVIVSDTLGKLFVKHGEHRCETKQEAHDFAANETLGKARGLVKDSDILGVWDMTDAAIQLNPAYDPTLPDHDRLRGYDNEIRDQMPQLRERQTNHRGGSSYEMHPIPKKQTEYPNWREQLRYDWDKKHVDIQNGGVAPELKIFKGRPYIVETFNKLAKYVGAQKYLLAATMGAGKEASTLATIIHLHDIKKYTNKVLHLCAPTIPSTVNELLDELATVAGMNVDGYGFVDFARIKLYVTQQWYDAYRHDCKPATRSMLLTRATVVESVRDIPATHDRHTVPLLVAGYHDVALKSKEKKLHKRYAGLEKRIGVFCIGEAHQMLSKKENTLWKNLNEKIAQHSFKLFVTGTPIDFIYSNLAAESFAPEQRTVFTRDDMMCDKRSNPKSDYHDFPDFNFYRLNLKNIIAECKKDPNWKDDAAGFTWDKLFAFDAGSNKFIYEQSILRVFGMMFKPTAFDENGGAVSVYNAPGLCEAAKQHCLLVLPVGDKEAPAKIRITALKALLDKHNIFAGTVFDAYEDNLGERKIEIANTPGRTLTLTCRKDCTGTNIPEWGTVVFMRSIGDSVKLFEQTTGRVGRKSQNKFNCGVFIADLEACININVAVAEKLSIERKDDCSTRDIISRQLANYNYYESVGDDNDSRWEKMDSPNFAAILEEHCARGTYGVTLSNTRVPAPAGFILEFDNKSNNPSIPAVELNSNGNDGAKNKDTEIVKQLGLPLNNSNNSTYNADDNFHAMKAIFIMKCQWLALIHKCETVANCVDLIKQAIITDDKKILRLISNTNALRDANLFITYMNADNIDVPYTNRWLHKFNSCKHEWRELFTILSAQGHASEFMFIAEPLALGERIANCVLDNYESTFQTKRKLKLIDPVGGRGMFLVCLMKMAEERGCPLNPKYVFYNDIDPIMVEVFTAINDTLKLGIPVSNIWCEDMMNFTEEHKKMKFNVAVWNFPFKQGMHLKFFNTTCNLLYDGGVMVGIHPSTPLINRKPTEDGTSTKQVKEIVTEYKTRITLINGNDHFDDVSLFVPLSITRVEKVKDPTIEVVYSHIDSTNNEVKVYDKLDDIFIHGNDIVLGIKDKIFAKMQSSIEDNLYRKGKIGKYYLTINKMGGNPPRNGGLLNPDFYCLINKKYENSVGELISKIAKEKWEQKGGSQFNQISLNSYKECVNTHHNLMTKFSRFALSLFKISSYMDCGELISVPFLDPSKKYSDVDLYDYFKLTQKEQDFINNYIGDWYARDFKHNPSN